MQINLKHIILGAILIFSKIGYSQNIACDVIVQYKNGYKIQETDGMRLIYDNKEGFQLFGKLIKMCKKGDDSLTAVRLIYRINTNKMENITRGTLRLSNSFKEGKNVKFTFKNSDGGFTSQSLPISNVWAVESDNEGVVHTCGVNIPNESLNIFTKKNIATISVPYYDDYFNVDVAYPRIIIDFYNCFLKN